MKEKICFKIRIIFKKTSKRQNRQTHVLKITLEVVRWKLKVLSILSHIMIPMNIRIRW